MQDTNATSDIYRKINRKEHVTTKVICVKIQLKVLLHCIFLHPGVKYYCNINDKLLLAFSRKNFFSNLIQPPKNSL